MDHNILDEVVERPLSLTHPLKGLQFVDPLEVMDNLETPGRQLGS